MWNVSLLKHQSFSWLTGCDGTFWWQLLSLNFSIHNPVEILSFLTSSSVFSASLCLLSIFPFLPGRWGRIGGRGGDGWWFVALNMLWWKTWFSRRSVRLARQEPSLICLASGVSTAQSADQAAGGSTESRALFTLQLTAHWGCFFLLNVPRFDVCLFSVNCKKLHIVGTWWVHREQGLLNRPKGHRLWGPEV